MAEIFALVGELRDKFGTGVARDIRKKGGVPAIIYGAGKKPVAVSIDEKEITKHYRKPGFISTVVEMKVGNQTYRILPKDVQLHPTTELVRHVDFVFLEKDIQKMEVPVVYEGKERALGVKRGGFFNIINRTITLLCDVNKIPKKIVIDVTNMPIGQSLKASSISLPDGCALASKKDFIIATIIGRKGGNKTEAEDGAPEEAKK